MALKASNTVAWSLAIATRALTISENSSEVIGFTPTSFEDFLEHVEPDSRSDVRNFIEGASTKPGDYAQQLRMRNPKTGKVCWYKMRCSLLESADGKFDRLCGICYDITDVVIADQQQQEKGKLLEELIQQRTKELSVAIDRLHASERFASTGMLAARIVHEINGPISGIRNAFYLISDSLDRGTKHYEYVAMIEAELDRLIEILRQLFVLYGPESHVKKQVDIRDLIEESRKMMSVIFSRKIAQIDVEIPNDLPALSIAPRPVQQVLYNILINALKASPLDQVVRISAKVCTNTLTLTIHNGGPAIPVDVQATLFEPFSRARTDTPEPGLGLGLYLSRCLMCEIGGEISLESREGSGTTVVLTFPFTSQISQIGVA